MKRKPKINQIEIFKKDTQGMNFDQKAKYLIMNDIERETFVASFRQVVKHQEKEKGQKCQSVSVKIIKPGQVCVCVLNMRGKPLMPTSPGKARMLLKKGKAKVIQRDPFTIQLKYPTGEAKQPIVLALDPGYKNVGFSAITDKRELISGEVIIRTDVSEKIAEKKMYRTNRRGRIPAYREPGFENRCIP